MFAAGVSKSAFYAETAYKFASDATPSSVAEPSTHAAKKKAKTQVGATKQPLCFVVDNGACVLRAGCVQTKEGDDGFAEEKETPPMLAFENVILKATAPTNGLVYDFVEEEQQRAAVVSRANPKFTYDQNILVNFDVFEGQMEHVMERLGRRSDVQQRQEDVEIGAACHSILVTESIGTFDACRVAANNLFFGKLAFERVAYGIDAVFAFEHAFSGDAAADFGVIVAVGYRTTHFIPMVRRRPDFACVKRLGVGGWTLEDFFLRLLQIKYPAFPCKVTFAEAAALLWQHAFVAADYGEFLRTALDAANQRCIQFPVPPSAAGVASAAVEDASMVSEVTPQEQAAAVAAEAQKKRDFAQKMKEASEAKRVERLAIYEKELQEFMALFALQDEDPALFVKRLDYLEFDDRSDLVKAISKTRASINNMRVKMQLPPLEHSDEFDPKPKSSQTAADFALLAIPDDELSEGERVEKRRLRMIKNSQDAREKIKRLKEKQEQQKQTQLATEQSLLIADPKQYVTLMYQKRDHVIHQILSLSSSWSAAEAAAATNASKKEGATPAASFVAATSSKGHDRRAKANRIKKMASMIDGSDEGDGGLSFYGEKSSVAATSAAKKNAKKGSAKKAGADAKRSNIPSDGDDDFGADDADWAIYHDISRETTPEEAEELEALNEEFERIQECLLRADPAYTPIDVGQIASGKGAFFSVDASPLFRRFLTGPLPSPSSSESAASVDASAGSIADSYKLWLNVERARVPEVLFQPHICGIDQCGVVENMLYVLKNYPVDVQQKMCQRIFVCGAVASRLPGFSDRLHRDLKASLPVHWDVCVRQSTSPLDAYHGAVSWTRAHASVDEDSNVTSPWITRTHYEAQDDEALHKLCH